MHVQGKFNIPDSSGKTAFIIGNGTAFDARSNAFTVKWDGTTTAAGDVYANNTKKLATEEYVNTAVAGAGGGGSDEYALKTDTVLNTTLSMGRKANTTVGTSSVALGGNVTASGASFFAEGGGTTASGITSHAEGASTTASGNQSHAEGGATTASGQCSHAEGSRTQATDSYAHAEGDGSQATRSSSHAEGGGTLASGQNAHAEGAGTTASGVDSHSEGLGTKAIGDCSHAEGAYTQADGNYMHVQGKYNVPDSSGATAFIIGNGTAENARSNAFAVKWDGTLIMCDVSNGAYYKVYIDGGVLKTEAVV
jgi:hypothetical protein